MGNSLKSSNLCGRGPSHESEAWWKARLPKDYMAILERAVIPLQYSNYRELYSCLCQPFLIDHGTKSFALDADTGKKCYRLRARELHIPWIENPLYWTWAEDTNSRFREVAELVAVCWLDINATINTSELSRKTTYTAYLIFKLTPGSSGLSATQEASIFVDDQEYAKSEVCIKPPRGEDQAPEVRPRSSKWCTWMMKKSPHPGPLVPSSREDGWMELPLGEFKNDGRIRGEMKMSLREVEDLNWKVGLIVEGIEVRPKKTDVPLSK